MSKDELKQEAEEYTKNLLKRLGIKEDMLLENQPKYLRHESMNFVALDVENVTDAYLASAEPREKRIEELEQKLEQTEKDLADYQFNYPTIKELQKENAELKEKFNAGNISFEEWLIYCKEQGLNLATQEMEQEEIDEMLKDCWIASRYNSDATSLCLKQSVQLTKAKEIIKNLMVYVPVDLKEYEEAKQFINSEVEK